jgi:uncharacterized membrane-anchored protein YhcB (DUF1043 family)
MAMEWGLILGLVMGMVTGLVLSLFLLKDSETQWRWQTRKEKVTQKRSQYPEDWDWD